MEIVSISSLSPFSAIPANHGFKALVTLLWPFSSATGQCALLLADPDARQRYQKGQVRVRFTGPSAHQIAISGIGIGDSVQVALVGVQWLTESDTALVKTPGKSVDGELLFKNRLHMIITRGENELKTIDIDQHTLPASPQFAMLPPSTPIARSKPRTSFDAYGVAVYSSPAFMKRLRLSEGGTPYTPVPVSEDDDQETVASRKRRRVSYKKVSEWKFDAREPSPEKEQDHVLEDADGDENAVTKTAAPETATIETGNVAEPNHDLEMQDVDEPTENAVRPAEEPDSDVQIIKTNAVQPVQEINAQEPPVEAAREEPPEIEAFPRPVGESLHVQELEIIPEPSQLKITTSLDAPPSDLPRLTVLPTESELLEQMARAQTIGRPTTPILQPLLTEGLPLPSPFPTSAQKIPSPIFSNAVGALKITQKEIVMEDTSKAATHTSNINETAHKSSSVSTSQEQHLPENGIAQESVPSPETVHESAKPSQQELDQQEEVPVQKPRVVADTYDGYAEEHPMLLSSGSEDEEDDDDDDDVGPSRQLPAATSTIVTELQSGGQPRGDGADVQSSADEESDEDMESSSEDSESDEASSVYDSDQIVALQEESGDEGAIEEPDWDYLERKLEQEEAALQQSREDLTARDPALDETVDHPPEDDAEDAVMHDDNSELDEDMLARSDDDSVDDDSDSSGYFDRAVMPGSDDGSSGESEVEAVDQSYQPSMAEDAMYSHPFGLDGAHTLTETRTALPSQAASETASVVGDETIAWRDRDAAVEALVQQARPQIIESTAQAPTPQYAIPPSSSRLDVVELLDDSDSEGEGDSTPAPVVPETVDFSSSVSLVKSLLNNKQKDAHLELSGPVTAQIRSEIRKISDRVDSQSTKWTKFNALKTICKIGANVVIAAESGNMFAEGVKYRLKEDEVLVDVCWKVYNKLSNEEKQHKSQLPEMLDCLDELEERRDYCFEGFTDFLKHFKHNRHHLPVETIPQQLDQRNVSAPPKVEDQEAQRQSAVMDEHANHTPAPQIVEKGMGSVSINRVSSAEQHIVPTTNDPTEKATESSDRTEVELEEHVVPEADVETATPPQAELVQDMPASVEDMSPSHPQSLGDDVKSHSEADGDEFEAMSIGADSLGSADERDVDPALPEEDYEIDPALLEDVDDDKSSHSSEGYEIDPALLQEEHEIDPALLAEGHDDMPSNDHPSSPQADETMSEAPEPDAFSVVDDEERSQQSLEEEVTSVVDESMTDEALPMQIHEEAISQVQEASLVSEVQASVEVDPETLAQPEADSMEIEAPPASISEPDNAHEEGPRPLSSSSFRTLSPTPGVTVAQELEPVAETAAEDSSHFGSQMPEQPIEELDLSQAEPSWTSRLSQFSQSRSSRAHTRSETILDSADEEATDLEAENFENSSRPASQEPETQASLPHGAPELSKENLVQPSQELGTALSQFLKQTHGPSGMQSQLAAITETPPPDEGEEITHETGSQVGLDDDLLADYAQIVPEPEVISSPSNLPPVPSTPRSTKKPARPLTLFRGRKSIGSRLSIGGDEQQTRATEQQARDGEQQAVQDEVMQDLAPQEPDVSTEISEVMESTVEGDKQVQDKINPNLISEPSPAPEIQSQAAQEPQQAKETTSAIMAPEPEASVAVEQPQASEVVQASSEFQLKPTLKPFAEVEASLFGTPIKGKKVAPQEPQSAPSQTWRSTLSTKMSEVPVIGSWFTPRRTTEVQKAATEHKATTSSTSFVEETPTKTAAVSARDRQKSISPPPLQRCASQGTSTALSYFTPLAGLHQHLNQQSSLIDIVAVCTTATTTAERAKSGPKDYYTTFRIVDQPLHEYSTASQDTTEGGSVEDVKVEIFRPFRQSLPKASPGDVVLLRGFVVRSRNHKSYLLSTAASGWCVWRYGEPAASLDYGGQEEEDDRPIWARKGTSQRVGEDGVREEVTGPPVEIGDEEREKVAMVKIWWETLEKEEKAEEKEEHDIIMID
jgi:type III secretion system FlhB-like substrate exporter